MKKGTGQSFKYIATKLENQYSFRDLSSRKCRYWSRFCIRILIHGSDFVYGFQSISKQLYYWQFLSLIRTNKIANKNTHAEFLFLSSRHLEANQNKNNCLVSNFLDKLKFPALFSVQNRWEKRAGYFNLSKKLLSRQLFLFLFASNTFAKRSHIWTMKLYFLLRRAPFLDMLPFDLILF